MYRLTKTVKFDAAHRLPDHPGKCKEMHGHTWVVVVEMRIERDLPEDGMVADFGDIKKIVHELDHKNLNTLKPFDDVPPTAENIARHLSNRILERWPGRFDHLMVSVEESEGAEVSYVPPCCG